ncbi:MAG: DUF1592 domain-containing protein [Planctomycetota bacterium]|nr:DUF1592 domain-containing protein [Planctomycetota bacterium]
MRESLIQNSVVQQQAVGRKAAAGCRSPNLAVALAVFVSLNCVRAAEPVPDSFAGLADEYRTQTRPLLQQFCLECHSTAKQEGDLDLERFAALADVRRGTKAWLKVVEMLDNGEMPPAESKQPSPEQRKQLRGWVERYLHAESLAGAGDPGPVVLRRLNNAEYTYTIRDLTGVDLDPAREFPTDSAAGEGFTNAGNALSMSPALLTKYLDAGKEIARHAVLLPDGIRFSKFSTQRDWTNETLLRIRQFYRQRVEIVELGVGTSVGLVNLHGDCRLGQAGTLPLEKYFAATLAERAALGSGEKTISVVAAERGLNARYLGLLWTTLTATEQSPILDGLRTRWRDARPEDAATLVTEVAAWQRGLWAFNVVGLMGRKGSGTRWQEPASPLVAQQEFRLPIPAVKEGEPAQEVVVSLVIGDCGDGNAQDFVVWHQPRLVADKQPDILLRDIPELKGIEPAAFGKHPNDQPIDAASLCVRAPAVITLRLPGAIAAGRTLATTAALDTEAGGDASVQPDVVLGEAEVKPGLMAATTTVTLSTVTALYPDTRTLSYQKPVLIAEEGAAKKKFAAAMETHSQLFPISLCYPQVVPTDEVLTLTQFHREDEHLVRLVLDEAEQREIDQLWDELRFVSQDPLKLAAVLDSLVETTKDHPQDGGFDEAVKPFHERADAFRKRLVDMEPKQLDALIEFASRAFRRPLDEQEAEDLRALYRRLRSEELSHEDAFRLVLARVFVAAPFLYRFESVPDGASSAQVSHWELASRLSYFLWSSLPDEELRRKAADGSLGQPEVLEQQTRRMLKDARVRRLGTEFACQWLHIYDFPATEAKSAQLFPEFTELRGDMYEESILFLTDLFQGDASLLGLLNADHTFVNERLAKFYGVAGVEGESWRRIEGIQQHGRGGILGLAATLAKQSGASRTSPILRGNWVSEVLLGEKLPRPPKNVPQLADSVPDGLTERQMIERHSSDAACAKCHQRVDPLGFALEGFDAIGRRRERSQTGLAIDTKTTLADGHELVGLTGLRTYLLEQRRQAVVGQFCRKLLGYALGRETQLSDQPLLAQMQQKLAENGYRTSTAVLAIVQSRQFREIRGRNTPSAETP